MLSETNTLDELLEHGWRDAKDDPPEDDRRVQIAYDDGSFGPRSVGFCDSVAGDESGRRVWWSSRGGMGRLADGVVLAWRDLKSTTDGV